MSTPEAQQVDEFQQRMTRLEALLAAGDEGVLREFLEGLHPSDLADIIEHFDEEEDRVRIL
ncbi:MAG: hypothetical protein R3314_11895, partial [Longimicrobiales bacterium]|nr:hypothetical protein [Longimicrobiales bacterium]